MCQFARAYMGDGRSVIQVPTQNSCIPCASSHGVCHALSTAFPYCRCDKPSGSISAAMSYWLKAPNALTCRACLCAGTLPVMGIFFFFMLRSWNGSVDTLAEYQVRAPTMCIAAAVHGECVARRMQPHTYMVVSHIHSLFGAGERGVCGRAPRGAVRCRG